MESGPDGLYRRPNGRTCLPSLYRFLGMTRQRWVIRSACVTTTPATRNTRTCADASWPPPAAGGYPISDASQLPDRLSIGQAQANRQHSPHEPTRTVPRRPGPHGWAESSSSIAPIVGSSCCCYSCSWLSPASIFGVRASSRCRRSAVSDHQSDEAKRILAERFARGDINSDEFLERASMLNWAPGTNPLTTKRGKNRG